jgi:mono/diheme cytochrome c family protein
MPILSIFSTDCFADDPKTLDLTRLPPAAAIATDFARDIQPLFAERCVKCHGSEKQKGGLRLNSKIDALKGGDDGKVIVPGNSSESRLIHLVAGLEPDAIMPPKGERLTPEQVGILRAWIDQGANWPDTTTTRAQSAHWSLQPVKAPVVPPTNSNISPVDAFITVRLATNGLTLSAPADRATLIRRLSFDLVGLPPSLAEIDEFTRNKSPKAYEQLVERLLASPNYGERWGRHWLDVARYTESQGFEYDKLRENAWHYRDYVIKSFNEDKPYDRFMKEQVAGDVLDPVTSDGIIGTSLLVCGAWDEAGNNQANVTQKAITREEEMEDMISVVGQTFLGLTINCARCHSHKFDPIPQEEYYRIKSVFDGVKHGERPIASEAETKVREEKIDALKKEIATAQELLTRIEGEGWKRASVKQHPGTAEPGPTPFARWTFENTTNPALSGELQGGAKIKNGRLQLAKPGEFYKTAALSRDIREKTLEAWATLSDLKQGGGAVISIQSEDGSVFDAIVFGERQRKKWVAGSNGFERTRDLEAPEETSAPDRLVHMAIVYRKDNSIAVFRNGEPYGKPYTPDSPLQTFRAGSARVLLGMRHTGGGKPFFTGEIKETAVHDRALSEQEIAALFRAGGVSIPESEIIAQLTDAERTEREEALAQLKKSRQALDTIKPLPVSYAGTRVQPAPTHKLKRGDVKSPEEVVTPAALSAISDVDPEFGLKADAPEAARRLKFAEWLAHPRNPLPARVMANRIWHFHFGQGLVSTPNDFGVSGARPTHPELLDWLAMKFIESGWSVKELHRLIVNSATYQQSSQDNPKAMALDGEDTLLWRFPPHRLEAETVRDAVLAVSGQLNLAMGGPSFRPFEALKFPANAYLPVDKIGAEFNRRTVYRMNVNSGKEPLLDAFDCPDPSVKTPRRGVTTTPLQALALMNNSFIQRHAGHLADRALKEAANDLPRAIQTAYRLSLGRAATDDESKRALAVARERSLTNVCWALLNSTEFVYVR